MMSVLYFYLLNFVLLYFFSQLYYTKQHLYFTFLISFKASRTSSPFTGTLPNFLHAITMSFTSTVTITSSLLSTFLGNNQSIIYRQHLSHSALVSQSLYSRCFLYLFQNIFLFTYKNFLSTYIPPFIFHLCLGVLYIHCASLDPSFTDRFDVHTSFSLQPH